MTQKRNLAFTLIAEILVMIAVMALFRILDDRVVASLFASQLFILLGCWIVFSGVQVPRFRSTGLFWVALIYLFAVAAPMFITRVTHLSGGFNEARILGMSGGTFHRMAETVYLILIIVTLWEIVREVRRGRA